MQRTHTSAVRRGGTALALVAALLVPVLSPDGAAADPAAQDPPGPVVDAGDAPQIAECLEAVRSAIGPSTDDVAAAEACDRAVAAADGTTPTWVAAIRQLRVTGELDERGPEATVAGAVAQTAHAEAGPERDRPERPERLDELQERRLLRERTDRQRAGGKGVGSAAAAQAPGGAGGAGEGGEGGDEVGPPTGRPSLGERAELGQLTAEEQELFEGVEQRGPRDPGAAAPDGDATVLGAPDVALAVGAGSIAGTVTEDGTGTAIQSICVDAWTELGDHTWAETAADGSYLLSDMADGSWIVWFYDCWSDGHVAEYYDNAADEASATPVVISGGAAVTGIDAALAATGTISGTVVADDGGAPLEGVCVDAWSDDSSWYGSGFTDATGAYTVTGLVPGSYELFFRDCNTTGYVGEYYDNAGYDTRTLVSVNSGQDVLGIDASLAPGGSISGTVVSDVDGTPLQDACVYVWNDVSSWGSAQTDASGNYLVTGLHATPHYVEFYDCDGTLPDHSWELYDNVYDYDQATLVTVVAGATTTGIDVGLGVPGTISGTVVADVGGAALADICVDVVDGGSGWGGYGFTDVNGDYTVTVPPGTWYVSFYDCSGGGMAGEWYDDTDFANAMPVVVASSAAVTGIDAGLSTGGAIAGTVVADDGGAPLQGVCVDAWTADHGSWGGAYTSSDGSYEITGLSPGGHYVEFYDCWSGGYANEFYDDASYDTATLVTVSGTATTSGIDAGLGAGSSITGTVTAADGGAPLQDICVDAYGVNGSSYGWDYSAIDGTYQVSGLGAGSYVVEFYDCNTGEYIGEFYDDVTNENDATPVVVATGADTTGIDASLIIGATITGTVVDTETSALLQDICVWADGPSWNSSSGITGADGTYSVSGLVTGDYLVEFYDCSDQGYITEYHDDAADWSNATPVSVTAPAVTSGIDAGLLLGGSITGTVTEAVGGNPAPDVCVDARSDTAYGGGWTAEDGTYAVRGLPSGDYVVEFSDCSNGALVGEFYDNVATEMEATPVTVVRPAATTNIDAVLSGGGTLSGHVSSDVDGSPLAGVCVEVEGQSTFSYGYDMTDASGNYTIVALPQDDYVVWFLDCSDGSHVSEYYNDVSDYGSATAVFVTEGANVVGIDAGLGAGASINGTVTAADGGAPLQGICVDAYALSGWGYGDAETGTDGSYSIGGLDHDDYVVYFTDCTSGEFVGEYYDDATEYEAATPVTVAGGPVLGIDAALARGGSISGTITDSVTSAPLGDICLYAGEVGGHAYGYWGESSTDGTYVIGGLPTTGQYTVVAYDCSDSQYLDQWYSGATSRSQATPVDVTFGTDTPGIDLAMAKGAWFEGVVTEAGTSTPLADVCVEAIDADGFSVGSGYTDATGSYVTYGVPAGSYRLKFTDCGWPAAYATEYHDDVHALGSATAVTADAGTATTIHAALAPFSVGTGSISGVVQDSGGTPLADSWITTCAADGRCVSDVTDATGAYELTALGDGTYTVHASAPTSSLKSGTTTATLSGGGATEAPDIVLETVEAPPTGTSVGGTEGDGSTVPVVFYNQPFDMTVIDPPCGTGTVTYSITSETGEVVTGELVEDPPGTWTGDIIVPFTGTSDVVISQDGCVDTIDFNIYIDPSGTVKTPEGDPIEGATVTLYRSDTVDGTFEVVPDGSTIMAPTNRTNPDLSDAEGKWGWDVAEGYYYVTVEKAGCVDPADGSGTVVSTPIYEIPPAVTDVDLRLNCSGVVGLEFVPVTPCAYFDTRSGTGAYSGKVGHDEVRTFRVTGTAVPEQGGSACDEVPADAVAVELNLVSVLPTGGGNLQVAPSGVAPDGGVVNFQPGATNSNALSVGVDDNGDVDVTVKGGPSHVRGVVLGYYTDVDAAGYEFVPMAPCAVFDTRSGTGDFSGKVAHLGSLTAQVTGTVPASQGGAACAAPPATAVGVALNLVAVLPSGGGNLQVAPTGVVPDGGVVNFQSGATNSNALSVETGPGGAVDVIVKGGPTHVRGVVLGYYTDVDAGGYEFVPVDPCAVFDTRSGTGDFSGKVSDGGVRVADLSGTVPANQGGAVCAALPETAEVAHLNLVAILPNAGGNLQIAPSGVTPDGGVVNFQPNGTNSNALSVELDADGEVDVTVKGGPAHVRGVVLGYYLAGD